jgi:hypothetical protein
LKSNLVDEMMVVSEDRRKAKMIQRISDDIVSDALFEKEKLR